MSTALLFLVAVTPPALYLLYLMEADRREPEPLHMVLLTLALGIFSTVPSVIAEALLARTAVFSVGALSGPLGVSFLQVAPVEEFAKLAVVLLFVWKNRNFNEENDGIVYVTLSAIGFALFENVLYVFRFGFGTGIARALTSIPLHTFTGVIMGYFVGKARFAANRPKAAFLVAAGFVWAWFIHGAYDAFAMSRIGALPIVALVVALCAAGGRVVRAGTRASRARWDSPERAVPMRLDVPEAPVDRIARKYGAHRLGMDDEGRRFLERERKTWKAVAARILFVLAVAALLAGIALYRVSAGLAGASPETGAAFLAFFAFLALIPGTLGVMLEASYRRRAANRHYFQ